MERGTGWGRPSRGWASCSMLGTDESRRGPEGSGGDDSFHLWEDEDEDDEEDEEEEDGEDDEDEEGEETSSGGCCPEGAESRLGGGVGRASGSGEEWSEVRRESGGGCRLPPIRASFASLSASSLLRSPECASTFTISARGLRE